MRVIGSTRDTVAPLASAHVRSWSVEEFGNSQATWDELVKRSDADPLFMSWGWQWRWWTHHAAVLAATLRLAAVYAGDRLIGIAPFYSRKVRVRKILQSRRLELIGIAWRDSLATFSDYPDILADTGFRSIVIDTVDEWLAAQPDWDELLLCCTKRTGVAAELAIGRLTRRAFVREVDPLSAWRVHLPGSFDEYVQGLSANVRRKLVNQRRKLAHPEIAYITGQDVRDALHRLWEFSATRWNGALPPAHIQNFHREIAASLAGTGELRLSCLYSDGAALSILYCAERAGTVYYLQSGFDAERAQGVSPGSLHLGYAIEAACTSKAHWFDLLAGRGRRRDYKRDLLTEEVPVANYHVVRGALKGALYRVYERLQGRAGALHTN